MESRIGIYLRKDRATVACLASQGREKKLLDAFCVSVEGQDGQNQQILADQIAQRCTERRIKSAEAAVALDCALFMQHRVHSDFSDPRKIAATIRFDAEETLATDISDLAVAFRIVSGNESGTDLDVFTAERSVLTDILLSLRSNGTDPLTVEPDICLLSRYLIEASAARSEAKDSVLYALLSDRRGYLIGIAQGRATLLRAFPVNAAQDRNELLAREILLSAALTEGAEPPAKLYVADTAGGLNVASLALKVRRPVEACDLTALLAVETPGAGDRPNAVDLLIAAGAALPQNESEGVNFRNDHMPHLGKKMRLRNAVRFASVGFTILFLALGVHVQTQFLKVQQDRQRLMDKFVPEYGAVMVDTTRTPRNLKDGLTNLEGLLRRVKQEKSGQYTGQESVSAKVGLVIGALKSCAKEADLKIDSVEISGARIAVTGSTSSRPNTNKVFAAMPAAKLSVDSSQNLGDRNGRDCFAMTLKPIIEAAQKPVNGAGR